MPTNKNTKLLQNINCCQISFLLIMLVVINKIKNIKNLNQNIFKHMKNEVFFQNTKNNASVNRNKI
jgi:hypothetical protein